jgi:hypothetical protein
LGGDAEGLWVFGITGRCSTFDFGSSERFDRVTHQVGGGEWDETHLHRFVVDAAQWSDDDFALPPVATLALATERPRRRWKERD